MPSDDLLRRRRDATLMVRTFCLRTNGLHDDALAVGDDLELGVLRDVQELKDGFLDHEPEAVADGGKVLPHGSYECITLGTGPDKVSACATSRTQIPPVLEDRSPARAHGEIDPSALLQLVLRPNTGLGSVLSRRYASQGGPAGLVGGSVGLIAASAWLIAKRHSTMTLRRRALSTAGVMLATFVPAQFIASRFDPVAVPVLRLLLWPSLGCFWMTLWILLPPGLWKVGVTLSAASVLANGLSAAVPPFGVVTDFIHSRVRSGTFNVADTYMFAARWLFGAAAVGSLARWFNTRRRP